MKGNFDFKKEWEKTKKQLIKFSKEASEVAKKGEREIVKFSHQGKLHIDSTAASLKRERLMYQAGKEFIKYSKGKSATIPTVKLKSLVQEINKLEKEQRLLKSKINKTTKKS